MPNERTGHITIGITPQASQIVFGGALMVQKHIYSAFFGLFSGVGSSGSD